MKGAFVLSEQPDLFRLVADFLKADAGDSVSESDGVVQLIDPDGRLLTVFAHADQSTAWEFRDGPFPLPDGSAQVDTSAMTACMIECRWEELFAVVVRRMADLLPGPLWVLDGNGVIWPATDVDPSRLRL